MMILVLDNYDSFTYNLVQYLGQLQKNLEVFRNDDPGLERFFEKSPERIVISPGPGRAENSGILLKFVNKMAHKEIPILGVCLGHQALGQNFGASIIKAKMLMHGKVSTIEHDGEGIYEGLPGVFEATRYHSLVLTAKGFPSSLQVTARSEDGEIMGIRHRELPIEGVQFHPESFKTPEGFKILSNFVSKSYYTRGEYT